ncbi:MAG: chromosome segregation protein SMC [Thaumarchaeota archaeon]|nr:chromosome segregation protein SMC [Nitrososphaerota archaeon]
MVYIKRLETRAFKSLGSRTMTLSFEKGLTVITGPNGSGKSNILDAVAFCLGENNPKMLRVPKLTALIYDGGTEAQRTLGLRVTVTLDNSDRALPVDSDSVTIARELGWNGESAYYLNSRRAQKNAITSILELAMLTPSGLNLVPQGRVTRISELAPDEKRRLIEELAGVAQFDEKKAEALKQLHDADSRLQIALARIDEIRKRVESLEGERNDHLRLRHLEDEIRWLKAVASSERLVDVRRSRRGQERIIESLSKEVDAAQAHLDGVRAKITAVEAERASFVNNVLGGEGGRHVEVQVEATKTAGVIDNTKDELRRLEMFVQEDQKSLPQLESLREETSKAVEDGKAMIKAGKDALREKINSKKRIERTHTDARKQVAKLEKQIQVVNETKEKLGARRGRLSEELGHMAAKIEAERSKLAMTVEALNNTQQRSQSFIEASEKLESSLGELRRLLESEKGSLEKTSGSLSALVERRERVEKEVSKALAVLGKAEDMLIRQEAHKTIVEHIAGPELSLVRLKEAAQAGAVEGYLGPLKELISWSPAFEGAVAAGALGWLNAVVVEDLKAMLNIVRMARRIKVGRITVIPLSELSGSKRLEVPSIQGVRGNLAEYVTCDQRLSGLVDFVYGGTIVMDSSQAAYVASTQGYRSVTPRGDLFEPGGRAFETGLAAKIASLADIIHDEASMGVVKEAFEALQKGVARRREDLEGLQKQIRELEKDKFSETLAVERLAARLESFAAFATKYRRLRKSIEVRVIKLNKEVAQIQRRIDRFSGFEAATRSMLGGVNNRLQELSVTGLVEALRVQAQKRNELANSIEDTTAQIRDSLTEMARLEANLTNLLVPRLKDMNVKIRDGKKRLAENLKAVESRRALLEELVKKHVELRSEEERLLEAKKRSMPILEEYDTRLRHLRSQQDEVIRQVSKLERERLSSQKTVEGLSEAEQRVLGELLLYGYQEPIEYFVAAEDMLQQLVREYDDLKGKVNLLADSQYKEVFSGYKNLSLRKNQLETERNAVVKFIESVDADKRKVFITTFERIDRELRNVFSRLTGGEAWLELENPDDIFVSGVSLMVHFPDKPSRETGATSGGEKSVASVSLILAVQAVQPSPIYIFDEVDANLDVVNSGRLADLLKERAEAAQILVASLKDTMVSRANVVHGVYMAGGVSQLVKYRPGVEVVTRTA